ncbi:MAG: anti-sigma factor antagonist [Rudaea sp.]
MAIDIKQEEHGGTRILVLSGRLDTETSADVELSLQDLLAAGDRNFLIDMTGIGYVSSAGLRVLLATVKQLEGGKGSLRLCGLNPSVRQVFDVAGFSKLFALFPDRAAALRDSPAALKAEPAKPEANKREANRPDAKRPEAIKPDPIKPDAVKAEPIKPDSVKPDPVKPDSIKPDSIKPEVILAQKVANLLGIKSTSETPHPKAAELARIAEQLLGLKPAVAFASRSPAPPVAPRAASPKIVSEPAAPAGVLGKIKGIFGGKT